MRSVGNGLGRAAAEIAFGDFQVHLKCLWQVPITMVNRGKNIGMHRIPILSTPKSDGNTPPDPPLLYVTNIKPRGISTSASRICYILLTKS